MRTEEAMINWVKNMLWDWPVLGMEAKACRGEGEYFLSHNIPVAHRVGKKIEVSTKFYSDATTRHQKWLRFMIPEESIVLVEEIKVKNGMFS